MDWKGDLIFEIGEYIDDRPKHFTWAGEKLIVSDIAMNGMRRRFGDRVFPAICRGLDRANSEVDKFALYWRYNLRNIVCSEVYRAMTPRVRQGRIVVI